MSAGSLPFWKQSRPALAAEEAGPGVPSGEAALPTSSRAIATGAKVMATALIGLLAFTFFGWLILGLTVMPTPRVDGAAWAVKWAAWPEDAAPQGALAAVTADPVNRGIVGRLGYQFGQGDITIQRIVAGPGGTVFTDADKNVYYDGIATGLRAAQEIPEQALGDAYLTICLSGCGTATGLVAKAPTDSILGEALGIYSPPFSVTPPAESGLPFPPSPSSDDSYVAPAAGDDSGA